MKTKMSKVLAIAASAVLLVCMLAVGVTPAAADTVTYKYTMYALEGTIADATVEGAQLKNNLPGNGVQVPASLVRPMDAAGTSAVAGSIVFNIGAVVTDYSFHGLKNNPTNIAGFYASKDGSTWDQLTVTETAGLGFTNNDWGMYDMYYTGTLDASAGYTMLKANFTEANFFNAPGLYDIAFNVVEDGATYGAPVYVTESTEATPALGYSDRGHYNGQPAYRFSAGTATDGEFIVDAGHGWAKNFRMYGCYGTFPTSAKITYQVSADKETWTDVSYLKTVTDPEGDGWHNFTHTGKAATTFRYLKVIVKGTDYKWDPSFCYAEFDDTQSTVGTAGAPATSYEKEKSFEGATVTPAGVSLMGNLGVAGTACEDGWLAFTKGDGKPAGGTATMNIGEVFTDICINAAENDSSGKITKIEVSADGTTWVALNTTRTDTGVNNETTPGWSISYVTYTGTVDEADGYKYVRVNSLACIWAMPAPALKSVQYNVPFVEPDPVGTATDPADSYAKTFTFNGSNATVAPEGLTFTQGFPGAFIDPYYAFNNGSNASAAGSVTVDLGEVFTEILFDVAENTNLKDGAGQRWDKIEVSANGTDWYPLNIKRIDSTTTVSIPAFSMVKTTLSATVSEADGYRYVRMSAAACTEAFLAPGVAAIKYNVPVVEPDPVGTASDPAVSYGKTFTFNGSNATVAPEGLTFTQGFPGAFIDPYYAFNNGSNASAAGSVTVDLGEVFTEILFDVAENTNLKDGAGQRWDKIEVSANGTDWYPLNIKRIDSTTTVSIPAFSMVKTTLSATVSEADGYRYVRMSAAACTEAFLAPGVAEIKYNVPATEPSWTPDLSENATEMNFDMPYLTPFLGAPYSYGFSGAGNPNQDSAPTAARAQDVEYIGATHTWMVTTGYTGVTRYAFEANAAKDFTFTFRLYSKDVSSLADKIKVYACEGFTGGYYGGLSGDRAHEVDPATPTNPTRLAVTFEEAATQPLGPDWKNICVVAAGDIPVNATNLYIELEGLGNGWEIGLIDFDYVSDPIVIVPLPDFADKGNNEEMFEDFASPNRLTLENDGQALSITNLKHAAQKFGVFNDVDNMLVVQEAGNDGSIIYNYNGVKQIDVRGWVNDASKDNVPVVIEVSADGETWTVAEATARLSQAFNAYSTYSLLIEDVADGVNFVKFTVKDGAEVSISDLQILYTNEAPVEDEPVEDDKTEENPDTGVVAPAAALIVATLSGAAAVISKRRR